MNNDQPRTNSPDTGPQYLPPEPPRIWTDYDEAMRLIEEGKEPQIVYYYGQNLSEKSNDAPSFEEIASRAQAQLRNIRSQYSRANVSAWNSAASDSLSHGGGIFALSLPLGPVIDPRWSGDPETHPLVELRLAYVCRLNNCAPPGTLVASTERRKHRLRFHTNVKIKHSIFFDDHDGAGGGSYKDEFCGVSSSGKPSVPFLR